ncbi:MAG: aldo/keto reductase [Flavobacteriaceae bacterium]
MKNDNSYSRIIAGAMTWGNWGKKMSTTEMAELMNHCKDLGLTTFDHADIYGGYGTEEEFGKALTHSGAKRESIQLISKCGIQYICEARENKVKHYDYSKEYIIWSAEESLRKLQTDYLDLFLLHRPSPLMQPEEIAEAISQLAQSGKIKEFGVSNFTDSQIALIETAVPVRANQVEFSITSSDVMFDGTLDDCMIHKRKAMAWSPLGGYFRGENEQNSRIEAVIKELQPKYQLNASQLLLAWILKHPADVHPVVGTTNPNRLADSLKAAEIEMDLEDWFLLHTASMGEKVP